MLKGLLDERYGDRLDLGMANFMAMNVPVIVVVLLLLWLYTSSFRFDGYRFDGAFVVVVVDLSLEWNAVERTARWCAGPCWTSTERWAQSRSTS